jgi:hypothetical protein
MVAWYWCAPRFDCSPWDVRCDGRPMGEHRRKADGRRVFSREFTLRLVAKRLAALRPLTPRRLSVELPRVRGRVTARDQACACYSEAPEDSLRPVSRRPLCGAGGAQTSQWGFCSVRHRDVGIEAASGERARFDVTRPQLHGTHSGSRISGGSSNLASIVATFLT